MVKKKPKKLAKKAIKKVVARKAKKSLKKAKKVLVKSKAKSKKIVAKQKTKVIAKPKRRFSANKKVVKKAKKKVRPVKSAKSGAPMKSGQFNRVKKVKIKRAVKPKKKKIKPAKRVGFKKKAVRIIKKAKPKKVKRVTKKKARPKRIVARRPIRPATATKSHPIRLEDFSKNNLFKAKIKVIGIGGGGTSIVSEIGKSLGKATFVIADTDSRFVKKQKGIKYFLFGQELTHGLGTGLNTELAKFAAEKEKEKIAELFENQDIVILIASLGGGVGSGTTQVFADISKKFNCITFGIFTLPFKFEGKNKHRIATKSMANLRKFLNVSITIPNERIFKVIDADTSITQAFSMINKNLIRSLESLIDLIYNPGVINIDFADLRAILQGKGNMAFLNTAEASGKDSSEKIMQDILNNPLYQNNNFTAEKILFNITGGNTLSMMEVDKISRMIASQNQKAKIIFGISKSSEYKNKIKTTLLMTGAPNGKGAKDIEKQLAKKEPKIIKKAVAKKPAKKIKKAPAKVLEPREEISLDENIIPVFNNIPVSTESSKLSIIDTSPKRAIRRSALEIKKAQEAEVNKKSQQEKEWEIPAFLRFKK